MLRGSKAIVTGGSRGIGFSVAKMLVSNGCKVIITGRKEEKLTQAADKIGKGCEPFVWDVSEISEISTKFNECVTALGGIDILVNNAGIFAQRSEWDKESLLNTTIGEWENVMRTNTSAVFFMMQSAVKYMLENNIKGNILNITSVAGEEPIYGAYGASKITSTGLTRGWGKMFADTGIVINGIAPGPVATEMNNWHEGDSMKHNRIPFGRFASADEIAELAAYLLSKKAEMICGETVILDGAYAIR